MIFFTLLVILSSCDVKKTFGNTNALQAVKDQTIVSCI